jgi:ribosomal protein S18 acetylase RimI-like enzyme
MSTHPLDDPIGGALRSRHSSLAIGSPSALRYPAEVAPFASMGLEPSGSSWSSLADVVARDGAARDGAARGGAARDTVAMFVSPSFEVAEGWDTVHELRLTQMTDDEVDASGPPDPGLTDLTLPDVPAMLDLTARTRPGPFERRTVEFGGYRGLIEGDRLLAMAGRRLSLPGWTEISAVCTDPDARGRGLAGRLVVDVARGIRAGGDRAFLHVAHGNPARGLYERLGFRARAELKVCVVAPSV